MKAKNKILYFLQEIFIVVIGVIIAVSIGNYKENIKNQDYLDKTLKAIENEIELSQVDLDTVLVRHLKLYEKLDIETYSYDQKTLAEFLLNSGGVQVATIQNVSLRFFISYKAELIEFDIISQLLEIEFQSKLLASKYTRLTDFAYLNLNDQIKKIKRKFSYILADVIDSEQTLLASYSSFLNNNDLLINK